MEDNREEIVKLNRECEAINARLEIIRNQINDLTARAEIGPIFPGDDAKYEELRKQEDELLAQEREKNNEIFFLINGTTIEEAQKSTNTDWFWGK